MRQDPKGYYKILNVSPSASDDEIKIAYRNLAKRLHPDLNPGVDTTAIFQKVNEAYSVLSDPIQRAKYSKRSESNQNQSYNNNYQQEYTKSKESVLEPYRCSACNCVSHKLRHIKYNQVVSYIFGSNTTTIWGVFCERCAAEKIRKASLITGAFGWMSVPGVFHTAFALGRNLTGGRQENSINMEICARQALYYHQLGEKDKAVSAAFDAIEFANSIFWSSEAKQRAEELKPLLDSILKSNSRSEYNRSYENSYSESDPVESKNNQYGKNQSPEATKNDVSGSDNYLIRVVCFIAAIGIIILLFNGLNSKTTSNIIERGKLAETQINDLLDYKSPSDIELNKILKPPIQTNIDYRHIFNSNRFCVKCRFSEEYLLKNRIYCTDGTIVENSNTKESEDQKTNKNDIPESIIKITNSSVLPKIELVTNEVEIQTNAVKGNINSNRGFNFNKYEHRGPSPHKLKQNK